MMKNTVLVDELWDVLTQNQILILQILVDPLQEDNDEYGINVYNQTVRVVAQILNSDN